MVKQIKKNITRKLKIKKKIPKGLLHIQANYNNTIITISDLRGEVFSWSSAGACGFKGRKKRTPFASQIATETAIRRSMDQNLKQAEVMINGPGPGRDMALRAIKTGGLSITLVKDITPIPHNGCRQPKQRRL
uniref:Small ribosomal subunit protein uS11c n=1 Tax=Entransia fimbriata TaxID=130991 RepID=A0A191T4U2_9VIRI|nr:ribosomal protein S11 [Entransia fimbriata]ANI25409.1 ribosomal protein S11 [Entransia fimbriata]WKT05782.1 ribosomal protein S11 [Entransia fimbriata]WKT05901.1 ribosomal protein S11 [Entransia fimbriata]